MKVGRLANEVKAPNSTLQLLRKEGERLLIDLKDFLLHGKFYKLEDPGKRALFISKHWIGTEIF